MYTYVAKVVRVVDGDTVKVDINLGFSIIFTETLRILDLDTPEIFKPIDEDEKRFGYEAKARAEELLKGETVVIKTHRDKKGKYGRYLADIYLDDGRNYSDIMKEEGFHVG